MKIKFLNGTIIFVLCTLSGCTPTIPVSNIYVNAAAAIIQEADSGKIIFEKNADWKFPPASTAKVMTAIVVLDNLSLNEEITLTKKATYVMPTIAGLRPGVRYKVEDLIAAILIKSANDAAVALAEAVSGNEKEFSDLMNKKAEELGMENTHFATASGLPTGRKDKQYTTVRDLATLMRYASKYKIILETMSQKEKYIYGSDERRIYLKAHNKSLFWDKGSSWGKTGYTRQARYAFVGIDPSFKPSIVFSILKSNSLWNDVRVLNENGMRIYKRRHESIWKRIFILTKIHLYKYY